MTKCKTCGADTFWVKMTTGKSMLVNAEPSSSGNIIVDGGIGKVIGPRFLPAMTGAGLKLYTSHFATCPQSAQHRKPRA